MFRTFAMLQPVTLISGSGLQDHEDSQRDNKHLKTYGLLNP